MKHSILKTLVMLCLIGIAFTQNLNAQRKINHGKPTDEELAMKEYAPDKDAEAVFLYDRNEIWYEIDNSLSLFHEREMRIKVLKEEGKNWADIVLPFRNSGTAREVFTVLKACAINMVDGKVVKTDVTKELINDELVSGSQYVRKIAVPEVRKGTIIDLRYRLKSDFIANIPSIDLQHSIPVKYSYYSIRIPSWLGCNVNSRGYVPLNLKIKEYKTTLPTDAGFLIKEASNEQADIPALKKTNMVYHPEDYVTGFDYEISSIHLLNIINKSFTVSWPDFCYRLYEDSQFGGCMRMKNLLLADTQPIADSKLPDAEKISKLAKAVRNRVRWNDRYSLFSSKEGLRSVIKKGLGNSADMNFLLYCALVSSGYKVVPVFVNPRHMGRLPYGHPMMEKINAFVLRVTAKDGKHYYIDAADKNSDVNVLPYNLAIINARVYDTNDECETVDLTKLSKHQEVTQIEATLGIDGTLEAKVSSKFTNLMAVDKIEDYRKYSSEDEYVESLEKHDEMTFGNYEIAGLDTMTVTERYTMTKQMGNDEGLILLDATLGRMKVSNPFTEENRVLPVEFDYPQSYTVVSNIRIPEGYTIEEAPKSAKLDFNGNDITLNFRCNVSDQGISTQIRYSLNRLLFANHEYKDLYGFFAKMAEVFNQQIVLKKK